MEDGQGSQPASNNFNDILRQLLTEVLQEQLAPIKQDIQELKEAVAKTEQKIPDALSISIDSITDSPRSSRPHTARNQPLRNFDNKKKMEEQKRKQAEEVKREMEAKKAAQEQKKKEEAEKRRIENQKRREMLEKQKKEAEESKKEEQERRRQENLKKKQEAEEKKKEEERQRKQKLMARKQEQEKKEKSVEEKKASEIKKKQQEQQKKKQEQASKEASNQASKETSDKEDVSQADKEETQEIQEIVREETKETQQIVIEQQIVYEQTVIEEIKTQVVVEDTPLSRIQRQIKELEITNPDEINLQTQFKLSTISEEWIQALDTIEGDLDGESFTALRYYFLLCGQDLPEDDLNDLIQSKFEAAKLSGPLSQFIKDTIVQNLTSSQDRLDKIEELVNTQPLPSPGPASISGIITQVVKEALIFTGIDFQPAPPAAKYARLQHKASKLG